MTLGAGCRGWLADATCGTCWADCGSAARGPPAAGSDQRHIHGILGEWLRVHWWQLDAALPAAACHRQPSHKGRQAATAGVSVVSVPQMSGQAMPHTRTNANHAWCHSGCTTHSRRARGLRRGCSPSTPPSTPPKRSTPRCLLPTAGPTAAWCPAHVTCAPGHGPTRQTFSSGSGQCR